MRNKRQPDSSAILNYFVILILFTLGSWGEQACGVDIMPYTGIVDITPISGCCKKVESSVGFGAIVRIQKVNKSIGDLEVSGFSDFKYSEANLSKYIYLIGGAAQTDPLSSSEVSILRLSAFTLSLSYGLGFFSYNTKTTQYNLPILVAGIQGLSRLMLSYTLTDVLSINTLVSFGLGYSFDTLNFNLGTGVGITYRF